MHEVLVFILRLFHVRVSVLIPVRFLCLRAFGESVPSAGLLHRRIGTRILIEVGVPVVGVSGYDPEFDPASNGGFMNTKALR